MDRKTTFKAPKLIMSTRRRDDAAAAAEPRGVTPRLKPIGWEAHFDKSTDVPCTTGPGSFRVYEKGGGSVVLLLLHGGGLSAMSWALFASALCAKSPAYRVVAVDLRGHGATTVTPEADLSKATLCADVAAIALAVVPETAAVCLMGHSMGGAIAVHVAASDAIPNLCGLVVVDVVEGSAVEALGLMKSVIQSRPAGFRSVEAAIQWGLSSGQVRNPASAIISMPPQVKATTDGGAFPYAWRVDLAQSEPFWAGWFDGLSQTFLGTKVPKLLILAGISTLDVELTIGQMQGKFQMQVFSNVGHCVHEDAPGAIADLIAKFAARNRLGKGKKVGAPAPG